MQHIMYEPGTMVYSIAYPAQHGRAKDVCDEVLDNETTNFEVVSA